MSIKDIDKRLERLAEDRKDKWKDKGMVSAGYFTISLCCEAFLGELGKLHATDGQYNSLALKLKRIIRKCRDALGEGK